MTRGLCIAGVVLCAAVSTACGEHLTGTPTSPTDTTQSPFVTQFGGLWSGSLVLTGVSGGECVGADLAARAGAINASTVTITQNLSDVTAVVRSASTGLSCSYAGNAALGSISMDADSCDAAEILFQCSNGNTRVLELVGSTFTATISGNTTTGTVATSYNVYSESTEEEQRKPVAGLTTQQQFTAVRQ